MKIAFVVGSLHMGGLEKVTVHIVNALSSAYDIDLIVLNKNNNFYSINESVNVMEGYINYSFFEKVVRKFKKYVLNDFSKIFYKEIQFLNQLYEKNNYDYIIASDGMNSMLVNEIISNNNISTKTKLISWLHNDYNTYFNNYYRHYTNNLIDCLKNSFRVVCLTNEDKSQYGRYNTNTVRIYNPLTINAMKVTKLKQKEIIFVGRLIKEQKGLDYLLEIAQQIKDTGWKIRVVGSGADADWLYNEIKSKNLIDNVILHGPVKENIEDIYANASMFISTSRWEGFGLVVTEAMACGLPVISFDNSGPKEILDEGKFGVLISKYDIEEFVEQIKELIHDKDKLEEYSEKSLKRSQDFCIELIKEEWTKILNA